MSHYNKKSHFNTELQRYHVKTRYPQFKCTGGNGHFNFIGTLQPKSTVYEVLIEYHIFKRPKVYIIYPSIKENTPHKYPDGSLCLYHPIDFEWNDNKLIANYIIPWTCAWLYFYEVWEETGIWYGDEAPHTDRKIEFQ